jgi:hypothetical protein
MIHEAVYSKLKNNAGVSALVSSRVYPQKASQGVTLPCVVYQRLSTTDRLLYHNGKTNSALSRFQIDCWARTPSAALQLSQAVVGCLHGWVGTEGGETIYYSQVVNTQDGFDLDTGEYVIPVDVEIFHREIT